MADLSSYTLGGGGGGGTATGSGGAAKFGCVQLYHKDGTNTLYAAASSGSNDLWTALTSANSAAVAGDRMVIGPGTYQSSGNVQLAFNSNLTKIEGAGYKATVLKSTNQTANTVGFLPASNQEFSGIDFEGVSQTDIGGGQLTGNQPFGAHTSDAAFTNIYMHDCRIGAAVDGFYTNNAAACSAILKNCEIVTEFDSVRTAGGGVHAHDFYNCNLTNAGTNASQKRGCGMSSAGKCRFFNCNVLCDDSADSGGAGSHTCIAYNPGSGTTCEVYGGRTTCINGSTNNEMTNSSGTLIVHGVYGSGTGGLLLTSGTITTPRYYVLMLSSLAQASPATSTTYFLGIPGLGMISATDNIRDQAIPVTGTIIAAYVCSQNVTSNGSAETSTLSLHQNNTTDITITSSYKNDTTVKFSNTSLTTAVTAGDNLCLKWVTPSSWSVAPSGVSIKVTVVIAY